MNMLRTNLFKGFAVVVLIFALSSGVLVVRTINSHVTAEAQKRVGLDLSSAWSVFNSRIEQVETIISLVATKGIVTDACGTANWSNPQLRADLEGVRARFRLDFMGIVNPDGKVVLRTAPPFTVGDYIGADPVIAGALAAKPVSAIQLYPHTRLNSEGADLAERAFFEFEITPRARPRSATTETRGMVLTAAFPVRQADRITGVVYGGVLVNRNHELIDNVHSVVYRDEEYHGRSLGTATVFLHDCRIATTVRHTNGNRALGTRVSKEVAERVLDNGMPWVGEAFVVRDWYLTAYDPIRDPDGTIIGMLYVGILKQPFVDYGRGLILRYILLSVFVLLIALCLSFFLAGRLARPIRDLARESRRMSEGEAPSPVPMDHTCLETGDLVRAFNEMSTRLTEREESLKATNRSYMETLSFVSHELRGPLSSVLNYVFLLNQKKAGPLSEKQQKAVTAIERNTKHLVDMVRRYLNLTRIESDNLRPITTRIRVVDDIVAPLIESVLTDAGEQNMQVRNEIPQDTEIEADPSMAREVFENLVWNAVKYGRANGMIVLRATPDDSFTEFSVWNEGAGFTPEASDRLFKKFSRLNDSELTQQRRGTGLGLFICRHIVEAHGGRISARSEPGQWAEFVFTLPRVQQPSSASAPEELEHSI